MIPGEIENKLEQLRAIKRGLKETINTNLNGSIDENTPFNNYQHYIQCECEDCEECEDILTHTIKVESDNYSVCDVNINGLKGNREMVIPHNYTCVIHAMPSNGYIFKNWDDGVGLNPREITVIEDKTYKVIFGSDPNYNPDTPDTPDEDDTLDEPWYFWNGNSSWKENGLSFTDFKELTTTKYTYGDKNDIFSDIIIISPKGAAVSMNLKNSLEGENEIKLDEINTSGLIFEKLPKEFTDNQDKYNFWGYVFLVDKLDKDSRLIITCKKII